MEDKIITISTYPYSRAQLLKGRLEAEGIECFLSNINLVQPQISGGVKIKIMEKDTERALKIIDHIKEEYGDAKQKTIEQLKSIRRILVPVDFSEPSVNACRYAIGLARKLKAEIKLLYSYFNPIIISEPYLEENTYHYQMDETVRNIEVTAKAQMQKYIQQIKRQAKNEATNKIRISSHLDKGSPEDVILNYAKTWNAGVIVMGTKGMGKGSFDYLGSVTKKIITKARIPVLVVPQKSAYRGISYMGKILYATDFDDSDYKSLRTLMTLLRPFDIRIYCVHIATEGETNFDKVKMNNLKEHFKNEFNDFKLNCDLLQRNDVVQGLEDYIEEQEIDLLALTTHKKGIIERLFNPSLAKQMLFHTNIPLLVFHSRSVG
jgi:nucleotide-binding universal stress UspA family protein